MDESIIKEAVDEEWQRIVSKIKGIFVKRYNYLYGKMIGCTFSGVGKLTEMKAIMGALVNIEKEIMKEIRRK